MYGRPYQPGSGNRRRNRRSDRHSPGRRGGGLRHHGRLTPPMGGDRIAGQHSRAPHASRNDAEAPRLFRGDEHMIRWIRVVLPLSGMIATLLLIYAALVGFELYCEWKLGQPLPFELPPSLLALFAGAVLFGLYRVVAFHPIGRPFYRAWLETTPWTSQK